MAYKSLVRPSVEYASTVLDPYEQNNIQKIEMVQRRAARYVTNKHGNRSSVVDMISNLQWKPLETRRKESRLCTLYKIEYGLVAIENNDRLVKQSNPYHVRSSNENYYRIMSSRCNYRKESFFSKDDPRLECIASRYRVSRVA